jgi:hypothetical protein
LLLAKDAAFDDVGLEVLIALSSLTRRGFSEGQTRTPYNIKGI